MGKTNAGSEKRMQKLIFVLSINLFFLVNGVGVGTVSDVCQDVTQVMFEQASLLGMIAYKNQNNRESGMAQFSIIDGQTHSSFPFAIRDQAYRALSPSHDWIITTDGRLWLHSIDGSTTLFQISDPDIGIQKAYWIDAENAFISWTNREGEYDALMVNPFIQPLQLSFPLSNTPENMTFISFSPNMQFMLLYEEQYQRLVLYNVGNERLFSIPTTENQGERPFTVSWLSDMSLAYDLNTDFNESTQTFNQEIFVSEYPFDTLTQLTDFSRDFGSVEFSSTGGTALNWSPDSNKVIFSMDILNSPGDEMNAVINAELYIYDRVLDYTERLCIFTDQHSLSNNFTGHDLYPSDIHWSPDSEYIAFVHNGNLYAFQPSLKQLILLAENALEIYDWQ